ncbi:tetratricopeptide repeat protein [Arachidicoccus sp.]|uniref:tetratricopeptide repeat protein n=1 Tax=Arachidicoccus sp. TaxID=1872624 RepID=UPI003D22DCD0
MNRLIKVWGVSVCFTMLATQLFAQATKANNDPDNEYKLAKEMYLKGQYSLAYPIFKTLNYSHPYAKSNVPTTQNVEAEFYTLSCGLMLNQASVENEAIEFIRYEHSTPLIQMLAYQLGEYYFRKEKFTEALAYYEKAGTANLKNSEAAQLNFHQGYSYFTLQRFDKAEPLFNSIRQIPSNPNYIDANYYYGFIEFYKKNYDEALSALKIAEPNSYYNKIVPYYIAEIEYFKGNKDGALSYAQHALDAGGQYYETNLKQLVGHILFEEKEYDKALPYLEDYISKSAKVKREDLYELSYCYYAAKQWNKAINGFKELGGREDSLAQNSMYLLADAYLRTDQKGNARNAFLFCSLNSSNSSQKEISSFNYAKLSYELGYQDVALNGLKKFIAEYPSSAYNSEAKELLVAVLSNTNNYKDALKIISEIGARSELVQRAYPRILYGRAVELVNDQSMSQAAEMINNIFNLPYNQQEIQPAYFWKGEIAYRQQSYQEAISALDFYLQDPQTYGDVNAMDAYYTLGYAYMRTNNYGKALDAFRHIAISADASSNDVQKDAYLREADCYFMQKNYQQASQIYDDIIQKELPSADYAYYQKAIIAGAYGRVADKVAYLQAFDQKYKNSSLAVEANLQMAGAYMASENFSNAIDPLQKVINSNDNALKPDAYLNLGVAYFNMNNDEASLNSFQKLISTYPNSEQSDQALAYVRNIFVNQNKPDEYVTFMQKNGKTVSYSEQDSLSYITAFRQYGSEDFAGAQKSFESYLTEFPQGKNSIDANFYLAELYNQQKDYPNALKYYEAVAAKAPNIFAEKSTLQAARINYFQLDDFTNAEQYYKQLKNIATSSDNKLESMRGLLRCQYKLQQWADADANAKELLQQKGIAADDQQMSNIIIAKNLQASGNNEEAMADFKKVYAIGKSEFAAEARYRVAEILYNDAQYKSAESAAFDVINKAGSYDLWITKSYILLGDIYLKEKDLFNAEATLKSVVDNATNDSLKVEAQQKLDTVLSLKEKKSKINN